jgi:hypothetical protein
MGLKRDTKLGFATSLHLALFALIARPVEGASTFPPLALGGASAFVFVVTLFYELGW